jgi:DNA-binding CsgD family transcriptional regulator
MLRNGGTVLLTCSIVSYAIASLLMLFTAISVKLNFNSLIYQIGFPIVALGMYLSILLGDYGHIGISVQLTGFCFLHLIMWGACAFLIKNFELPSTWVIGVSTAAFMAGQLIGALVSSSISHLADSAWCFSATTLTVLVILLCASLYMMSSRNMRTGWGLAKPDTSQVDTEQDISFAIRTIVSDFELTKREADMMAGLARGKNRKTLSEELCVSPETVKSHIQSIYKKMGIHSQQELIRYVEELREQPRR